MYIIIFFFPSLKRLHFGGNFLKGWGIMLKSYQGPQGDSGAQLLKCQVEETVTSLWLCIRCVKSKTSYEANHESDCRYSTLTCLHGKLPRRITSL